MKLPCLLFLAALVLVHPVAAADADMPPKEAILNRIHAFTGLDTLFAVESIENVPASEANIPFLEKQLEGKTAIKVTFKRGKLKLKSVPAGEEDRYDDRQFVIILDADAKNLLSVKSTISKKDPDIHPDQPLEKIESELRYEETYQSFPTSDPKITFLEALEVIQKAIFPALMAQQIDGFYVMHSNFNGVVRPLWIIRTRGGPTMPTRGVPPWIDGVVGHFEEPPVWQRNHMRHLVDAETGRWLMSGNSPSPRP